MVRYDLILCLLVPTVLGLDGKIVGGKDAKIEDYPYQVSIEVAKMHSCGGTLIRANTVVTAAHCTKDLQPYLKYMTVRAGSTVREKEGQTAGVLALCQHPKFNVGNSYDYDVTVLKLDRNFVIGTGVQIIPLWTPGTDVPVGTVGIVTGWGTLIQGGTPSPTLQVITMPKINSKRCARIFPKENITVRMNCYGHLDGGIDTCQGDSGGPLVINGKLAGIVSWGYGCAMPKYVGVYTNIANSEINSHINTCIKS